MHLISRRAVLLAGGAFACAPLVKASPFKTLRVIVPYPAGGLVDLQARIISGPLKRSLGQEAVVENVSGAAGAIGLLHVVSARPDGHEIGIGTDSDAILAPLVNTELKYRPGQLRLLGLLSSAPMALVAWPRSGNGELQRVLTALRQSNRELTLGSYGVGSNSHLLAEDFARRTSIRHLHVPYRGIAPLLQELLGGQIDMAFLPLAGAIPDMTTAGKIKLMGIATASRIPAFPLVPTLNEAVGIKGFVHWTWSGVMVSREMSLSSVTRLHATVQAIVQEGEVRDQFKAAGLEPAAPMTLDEAQRFLDSEVERYKALALLIPPIDRTLR